MTVKDKGRKNDFHRKDFSTGEEKNNKTQGERRKAIKQTLAGGAAISACAIVGEWSTPIVSAVILPAHAQTSTATATTTTTIPTTTIPTTTTTTTTTIPPMDDCCAMAPGVYVPHSITGPLPSSPWRVVIEADNTMKGTSDFLGVHTESPSIVVPCDDGSPFVLVVPVRGAGILFTGNINCGDNSLENTRTSASGASGTWRIL